MEKKNKIKFDVKTAQINAQRKKERRNTIYAWILLVLFVFWTIGSILSFVNTFAGCSTSSTGYISAKADEGVAEIALTGDEMNGSFNDFDITNYPSANYFDVTRYSGSNSFVTASNGVVNSIVLLQIDVPVYSVSLATTLGQFCPDLVVGETYTLSFDSTSSDNVNAFRLNSSSNPAGVYWANGTSRVIDASDLSSNIILYPTRGVVELPDGKFVWSSIMINKGTEVMPYFPYFKSLYNAGYKDGYDESVYGFMNDSFVVANVNFKNTQGVQSYSYDDALPLRNGGFSLEPIYYYFLDLDIPNFVGYDNPYFEIEFGNSILLSDFCNTYQMPDSTNAFIPYVDLILNSSASGNGTKYRVSLVVNTDGTLSFSKNELPSSVNSDLLFLTGLIMQAGSSVQDIQPFEEFAIYPKNGLYNMAYNTGYNAGTMSGDSFNQGYNKGFSEGERNGYDKGFNAGNTVGYTDGFGAGKIEGAATANDYSFMSLISATIDAPIQAFTKMFDFEILGVNLTNFFLSLLSVGIVLVVLKLIFGGA